jgi:hypothetical protein
MNILFLLFPVFVFFKDGKWGLVNNKGRIVKEAIFDELEDPNKLGFAVAKWQNNYCLVDSLGNVVIEPLYHSLYFITDSMLVATKDSISFVCNTKGMEVPNSRFVSSFVESSGNNILQSSDGKKGMVYNKHFLLPIYDSIWFTDRFWMVAKDGKRGIYDNELRQILPEEYEDIKTGFDYIIAKLNGKLGLFDLQGRTLFDCTFKNLELLESNYMVATDEKGKAKLYDIQQRRSLVEGSFDKIRFMPGLDDLYLTEKNSLEGLIDKSGKVLIENQYNQISYIGLNRLAATDSLGDHMYNMKGKKLSKPSLGEIEAFDSIPVTKFNFSGATGVVNINGDILLLPQYYFVNITKDKITYIDKGKKNVITFDEYGNFVEIIKNFGTIRITDTTSENFGYSFKQRKVIRRKGDRYGMTVLSPIEIPISRSGNMISITNFFLFDSTINKSYRSSNSLLDISLHSINTAFISPAISISGKMVMINRRGRTFSTLTYKTTEGKRQTKPFGSVGQFSEDLAPVNFANATENYKVKFESKLMKDRSFHSLQGVLDDNEIACQDEQGLWGYINTRGEVVIPPQYQKIQSFKNARAIVSVANWQYELIDKVGNNVLKTTYQKIERDPFSDSLYLVHVPCHHIGFMDKSFSSVLTPNYKDIKAIGNELVLVKCKNKLWGFKTLSGKPATDSVYGRARSFSEGYAAVYLKNGWGYIDTTGKVLLKPKYSSASDFVEGRALVLMDGKPKIINAKGETIAKGDFKGLDGFVDGLAVIAKNKKYGIMKLDGDWLVSPQFDYLSNFDENGIATAGKEKIRYSINKEGEIKEVGKTISPVQKSNTKAKQKELGVNVNDFQQRLGNNFPNVSIPIIWHLYQHNSFEQSKYIPYKPLSYVGIMSHNGETILPPIYQYIKSMGEGVFKLYHHNSIGYYSIHKGWLYKAW